MQVLGGAGRYRAAFFFTNLGGGEVAKQYSGEMEKINYKPPQTTATQVVGATAVTSPRVSRKGNIQL